MKSIHAKISPSEETIFEVNNDDLLNQVTEDLKKLDFNFYTYQAEVRARGNQPLLMKDILMIENFQAKTCKSCLFFRGEFGDKYLCRKPSSDSYLNDCFVNKKELDENKEFKELPFRYVGDNSYLVVYQIYSYNDIWSKLWANTRKV